MSNMSSNHTFKCFKQNGKFTISKDSKIIIHNFCIINAIMTWTHFMLNLGIPIIFKLYIKVK